MALSPNGDKTTTGADGSYTFRDIDAGVKYTVQAVKNGYESDTRDISITVGGDSKLDFHLKPIAGKLNVSPLTLDFGHESGTLTLGIQNDGVAPISWHLSENIDWLDCVPTSGRVPAKGSASVIVNVDRTGLAKGTYSQTIAISSDGGNAVVKINITVAGMLGYSPNELEFGPVTTSSELILNNYGTQSISYVLQPSNNWIIPSKTKGVLQKSEVVSVSISREGLTPNDYEGNLKLTAGDEQILIPVRMKVLSKELPSVTLVGVENVTKDGATFNGGIISLGSSAVSRYGFCWSEEDAPVLEGNKNICNFGDALSAKDFTYIVKTLDSDTKYYVRAYAANKEGISYSSTLSFRTLESPGKPSVSTDQAISVTSSQAVVGGSILKTGSNHGVLDHGHVWNTSKHPTLDNRSTSLGATSVVGPYKSTLSGLLPNTVYYVRAYATNEAGTQYGEEISFTTSYDIVSLTTVAPYDITHNEATSGGSISSKGGHTISECGVCWGRSPNPSVTENKKAASDIADRFTVRMAGFDQLSEYHARAYVKTETGNIYYGNDLHFKTTHEIKAAAASAVSVSAVSTSGAIFKSSVISDGNGTINDCGFVYSRTESPTIDNAVKLSCGKPLAPAFSKSVTGLSENTTYHVRAYISNEAGTAYGIESDFATLELTLPTVSEPVVGRVTYRSAKLSAKVISLGNGHIADCGFVYSTSPNPDISDHKISCSDPDVFSASISPLQPNTQYYARAYAVNEKGCSLGKVVTFTTADEPDGTNIDRDKFNPDKDWDK